MSPHSEEFQRRIDILRKRIEGEKMSFEDAARELADRLKDIAHLLHDDEFDALIDFKYDLDNDRWRRDRRARIIAGCAGQPAGTPTFIEGEEGLEPVLAPGYAEPLYKRPRRMSRRERKQADKDSEARRIHRLATMTDDDILAKQKRYEFQWHRFFGERYEKGYHCRASWFSERLNAQIQIWQNRETGMCKSRIRRMKDDTSFKMMLYINTWAASKVYPEESERKAQELLRSKVSESQFKRYFCTGMLIEKSKRTGLLYIFRRCRPIMVVREISAKREGYVTYKFIVALCVHAQGYYVSSWAGTLVPTDDIVAQLLLMRADERGLWRRSTQHSRRSTCADI